MTSLAVALALVCAYSQPLCVEATQVPVSVGTDTAPGAFASTHWLPSRKPAFIVLQLAITHPVAQAEALVHELTNASAGYQAECGDWEASAYRAQVSFYWWFAQSFGVARDMDASSSAVVLAGFFPTLHACQQP